MKTLKYALIAGLVLAGSQQALAAPGDSLQVATQKGVNYLVGDVVTFSQRNTCQACHRQGAALYGLAIANATGYAVNNNDSNGTGYLAAHAVRDQQSTGRWVHGSRHYIRSKTSYSVVGLAGYDRYISTRYSANLLLAADWLVANITTVNATQAYWPEDHGSQPTTYGHVPVTARMMIALARARNVADPNRQAAYDSALSRAANWIRANRDNRSAIIMGYTYEVAWAILGLRAAGAATDDPDIQFLVNRLYSERASGGTGWGRTNNAGVNEFDTGLAVFALCQAGERLSNSNLNNAANWLNSRQVNTTVNGQQAGYWQAAGFRSHDIPTTFSMLGLGCFGTYGVNAAVVGPTRQQVASNNPQAQTATFTVRLENTGAFSANDTYNLSVQGGLPGWTAAVSPQVITIPSGGNANVSVTVTTGTNLPPALPVDFNIRAISQNDNSVTDNVTVTVYTDPPPPVVGLATTTQITAGAGVNVTNRLGNYAFGARVTASNGQVATGPNAGVVTFYVGGVPVASDTDADGNGTFSTTWTPGVNWNTNGTVDFRAIYSGIDNPGNTPDLLPSLTSATINLNLAADTDSDGITDDIETGIVGTNPNVSDTDGDGCTDGNEYYNIGSNPLLVDTDGDGTGDCAEDSAGTDPLQNNSYPDADGDTISDGADPFPCDGTASAVQFIPSETEFGQLMFEDNWPARGDLDFNDAVIAYNYQLFYEASGRVSRMVLTIDPLAQGAELRNGLSIALPTSATALASVTRVVDGGAPQSLAVDARERNMVVRISNDFREFTTSANDFVNTVNGGLTHNGSQVIVTLTFSTPVTLDLNTEPFDLFFHRTLDETHQIHRPAYSGTDIMNQGLFNTEADGSNPTRFFVDTDGLPFVLSLPTLAAWPQEYTQIHSLYPNISTFASSGGALATDWYLTNVNTAAAYEGSVGITPSLGGVAALPTVSYDRTCTNIGLGQ